MKHTETYFGLQNIDGKITADNGETFLKTYSEMTPEEWQNFLWDVENWLSGTLSKDEVESLMEIMA